MCTFSNSWTRCWSNLTMMVISTRVCTCSWSWHNLEIFLIRLVRRSTCWLIRTLLTISFLVAPDIGVAPDLAKIYFEQLIDGLVRTLGCSKSYGENVSAHLLACLPIRINQGLHSFKRHLPQRPKARKPLVGSRG